MCLERRGRFEIHSFYSVVKCIEGTMTKVWVESWTFITNGLSVLKGEFISVGWVICL